MRFSDFVIRNIFRRPIRSVLTVSGIALAVGAIVALTGVAHSLERSLLSMFQDRGVDLIVMRAGGLQRVNSVLERSLEDKIRSLPNVEKISYGLVELLSFEEMDLFGVIARGLPADNFQLDDLTFVEGGRFGNEERRKVLLGKVLAANLNKGVGDELEVLPGEPFEVGGIYESFNIFENGALILPLESLQEMMGRHGEVTAFTVLAEDQSSTALERLREEIRGVAPYLEALPTREYVDTTVELRLARGVAWITSIQALVIGTIGMVNTMLAAVFERTKELTVLRAIGWRKRNVMKLILLESSLLCLSGAVIGSLLAFVFMRFLTLFSTSSRLVSGDISWQGVLHGFLVALFVGVVGGLFPAFRAAQLVPTEGLRHE